MFKKLLGKVAAVALAAGVCFGALGVGNIETKAYTEFSGRTNVQSIQLNAKVFGTIVAAHDQKWYQFNTLPDVNNWYTFECKGTGISDVNFDIYDPDGARIQSIESYNLNFAH